MSEKDFIKMYMGGFTPSKESIELYEIAKQYHENTETYDLSVCAHKDKNGVAMPSSANEMSLININAREERNKLCRDHQKFSCREIIKAIREFNDMP